MITGSKEHIQQANCLIFGIIRFITPSPLNHIQKDIEMKEKENNAQLNIDSVAKWVSVSDRLPEFGETVLVYCKIYGRFLATYEYIGDFQGEKYGNWRDFNGTLGILPPVYWFKIPEIPSSD